MAAGKELLGSYNPKMVHAGDYPVVTDSARWQRAKQS